MYSTFRIPSKLQLYLFFFHPWVKWFKYYRQNNQKTISAPLLWRHHSLYCCQVDNQNPQFKKKLPGVCGFWPKDAENWQHLCYKAIRQEYRFKVNFPNRARTKSNNHEQANWFVRNHGNGALYSRHSFIVTIEIKTSGDLGYQI